MPFKATAGPPLVFFFSFTCLLRLSPSFVLVFFGFLNFVVGFLFGLDLDLSLAYGSGRRVLQRLRTASAPQRLCVFGIGGALADKVFQLDAYRVECWSMVVMRSRFVLCQIHLFGCAAVVFDGSFSG